MRNHSRSRWHPSSSQDTPSAQPCSLVLSQQPQEGSRPAHPAHVGPTLLLPHESPNTPQCNKVLPSPGTEGGAKRVQGTLSGPRGPRNAQCPGQRGWRGLRLHHSGMRGTRPAWAGTAVRSLPRGSPLPSQTRTSKGHESVQQRAGPLAERTGVPSSWRVISNKLGTSPTLPAQPTSSDRSGTAEGRAQGLLEENTCLLPSEPSAGPVPPHSRCDQPAGACEVTSLLGACGCDQPSGGVRV